MGQNMAKKELARGEKFYMDQRFDEAVEEWRKVLKRMKKPEEKFTLSGRICLALCDVGKFREALTYAGEQCELANSINDPVLKSEAFFHLALCNEKSCEFSKAISYSKRSQLTHPTKSPFLGYINLCIGNAYCGTSEFLKAWNSYVLAMDEAKLSGDKLLEILTSAKMGALFCCLGDYESCIAYCNNSMDLIGDLMDDDPNLKYRRQVSVSIATAVKKMGRYSEAMDSCEDAMQLAMRLNDRPVQARCLYLFADIHRKRNDIERASPRYESASSIMSEIGDRLGQVEVLGGMAKAAACLRDYEKAIELNEKALELATKVGTKLEMLRCHARLQLLSEVTGDDIKVRRHASVIRQLVLEMDLFCGVCGDIIGQTPERLEPLSCGHFVHARCAVHLARSTLGRSGKRRPCPACRRNASLNPAELPT
ncbi:43 kDa receptor-associated protein of the synapse-like [Physella acuta]|uniref:43 kDa receptor-associated protein of the synapse-like n=1 Tax=Physella acuta TaxID=109671 RepID=UPI0027DAFAA7|nr:43 kDa receptor-associated protein of the synapse-like [Physella acuta]